MKKKLLSLLLSIMTVVLLMPTFAVDVSADSPPVLYFGECSEQTGYYDLFTDVARTKTDAYKYDKGKSWNVTWVDGIGVVLDLYDGFGYQNTINVVDNNNAVPIAIRVNGTNTLNNGLVINNDITIVGTGTLTVSSESDTALTINATVTINGPTIKCNKALDFQGGKIKLISGDIKNKDDKSFYETLYLAKKSDDKEYALYGDETFNFEFASSLISVAEASGYVYIALLGEVDQNIIFKQYATSTYIPFLSINANTTKLGGFDASEGTLAIANVSGTTFNVTGDIKAQKLYITGDGLTIEASGNILASEATGVTNELTISSSISGSPVILNLENSVINFEKGSVAATNAQINISKSKVDNAASIGINAHTISLANSSLYINDVDTGIKLYAPTKYGEGAAVIYVGDNSTLYIDATTVGIQGTYGTGGNYWNNISVSDNYKEVVIAGGKKAVASASISPIPTTKVVKSTDLRAVYFKVNKDDNYTTDYYYNGTTTVATSLTLKQKNVYVSDNIKNGTVTVDDEGARAGETVTITTSPSSGYKLDKITVTDTKGNPIEVSGKTFVMPKDVDLFPITVSATFKKTSDPSYVIVDTSVKND